MGDPIIGPKTILLTGCTGVLGTAFVRQYSDRYAIMGVARREPSGPLPVADFIVADVTRDAERVVQYVLGRFGTVDAVVNAAVFYDWAPLITKDVATFRRELETNLIAPLAIANAVLHAYWERRPAEENRAARRSVLHVSSVSGLKPFPDGLGGYATTKAALNMLTRRMAIEYDRFGIRVNALAPSTLGTVVPMAQACAAIAELIEGTGKGEVVVIE